MRCIGSQCECRELNSTCWHDDECCDGLGCVAGACQVIDGCTNPGDADLGCTTQSDCCLSLECLPDSIANPRNECCIVTGFLCSQDHDCCGETHCVDGLCACQAVGAPCADPLEYECCPGAFCSAGRCVTM